MDQTELTKEERALLEPTLPPKAAGVRDIPMERTEWAHKSMDPITLRRDLEVLERFHHDVADRFADCLSRELRRLVEVHLAKVESMAYSQFAFSRTTPTCLVVLNAAPLPTPLALDLDPDILYPVLDCLLGGGQQPCVPPKRPPTELEQRLASSLVRFLLDELHEAWEPLLAVDLSLDRIEPDAQRVRVVAPGDAVAALTFRVEVADQSGCITLCLPCRAIRKIVDKLSVGEYHDGKDANVISVDDEAAELLVEFEAERLSNVDLDNLRVGDVILSDVDVEAPVTVAFQGKPIGQGRIGSVGHQRAVEIVR
jgi:flagellar motor switch protein FliM